MTMNLFFRSALAAVVLLAFPLFTDAADVVHLDAPRGSLTIAVIGDLHGAAPAGLIETLQRLDRVQPLDALLILGDNFETGVSSIEDRQWDAIITSLSTLEIPLLPILGNHDYGNPKKRFGRVRFKGDPNPEAQTEFSRGGWLFPARNYVVSTPFAEIVMIDSTPVALSLEEPFLGSSTASEVFEFVEQRLGRTPGGKWRIVAGHHNVSHSGPTRFRSRKVQRRMERLMPVLERSRADLYLSAHQHHVELFRPADSTITHLISGLAGPRPKRARRLTPEQEGTQFVATVSRRSAAIAVLEIEPEEIRISFHDAHGSFPENVYALGRPSDREEELLGGS